MVENVLVKKINQSAGDRVFMLFIYLFLWSALIMVLYPLIYVVSSSLSSSHAVTSGQVWLWPVEPNISAYIRIFQNKQVLTGYKNSIIYACIGTTINVCITLMAAYPLSRKDFKCSGLLMKFFTFTMLFSGGLIPIYLVVKNLGMIDTMWALVIPNAMQVYYMIIAKTFFNMSIPEELYEASDLDGCSEFGILWHIALPLSKPIIAVISLMYAIGHWNSYFNALIYLKTQTLFPLQIILRNILIQNNVDLSMIADMKTAMELEGMRDLLKYALIVTASLPILAIYPFAQKYFIKGMMIGAVKG
ncbi:MAG TPA: carbohydrate ABC transporter permease [Ruminiclostridium sp.]